MSQWQARLNVGKIGENNSSIMEGGSLLEDVLKIGDKAPGFSLEATTAEKLSLSDYFGKKNVLVAFYGMDFTPG